MKLNQKQMALLERAGEAGADGIIIDGGRLRTAMALSRRGLLEWVEGSGGHRVVITYSGRMRLAQEKS